MKKPELLANLAKSISYGIISEEVIIAVIMLMEFYAYVEDNDEKVIQYGEVALSLISKLHEKAYHPAILHVNRFLIPAYTSLGHLLRAKEIAEYSSRYRDRNRKKYFYGIEDDLRSVISASVKIWNSLLSDAAEGEPSSQQILGANLGLRGRTQEALEWYQKAAAGGNVLAIYYLFRLSLNEKKDSKVVEYYEKIKKIIFSDSTDNQIKHITNLDELTLSISTYFFNRGVNQNAEGDKESALSSLALASKYGCYIASFNAAVLSLELNKSPDELRRYFYVALNDAIKYAKSSVDKLDRDVRSIIHANLAKLDLDASNGSPQMVIRAIYNFAIAKELGNKDADENLQNLIKQNPVRASEISKYSKVVHFNNGLILPCHLLLSCKTQGLDDSTMISEFHNLLSGLPGIFDQPDRIVDLYAGVRLMIQEVLLGSVTTAPTATESSSAPGHRATGAWDATGGASTGTPPPPPAAPSGAEESVKNSPCQPS